LQSNAFGYVKVIIQFLLAIKSDAFLIFDAKYIKKRLKTTRILFLLLLINCIAITSNAQRVKNAAPIPAAHLTYKYVDFLKNKRVGMVVNQSSRIHSTHLVDTFLKLGIDIKKIFCPEHGFRGNIDAGENVNNSIDSATKLPLISLYGKNKKPKAEDLKDIDVLFFDIQDVGVRFYTYLSTLHYVMEACAENKIRLLVLDRPNPNGYYIDGPVLKKEQESFVGLHPVPIVYGMTIGEYAKMINGEKWLANKATCYLKVIRLEAYTHESRYTLPVKPSPNLADQDAISLYPSLCLFEGTQISVGRGTYEPFKMIGHPSLQEKYTYTFIPQSIEGMSKEPPYLNQVCYGVDLRTYVNDSTQNLGQLNISWILEMYNSFPDKAKFFNPFFEKLAGTTELRQQIIDGKTEQEIRSSWEKDLSQFKLIREKYLMYK
jgi:uncharacterized protein YbbC (DUF1343 family)